MYKNEIENKFDRIYYYLKTFNKETLKDLSLFLGIELEENQINNVLVFNIIENLIIKKENINKVYDEVIRLIRKRNDERIAREMYKIFPGTLK